MWASVTNGIILCLNCSGVHRSLGVQVSFVRSVTMDSWSERQIKFLQLGGNENLEMFLEQYNIPKNSPPEFKFKTIACQYYRQRLESIVDGKQFNGEKPTLEQGLAVIDYSNPNFTPNNKYQSMGSNQSDQEEQSSYNKYLSQLSVFASKAAEKTKETYNKYSEKVKDPEFQQQVKEDTKKSLESAKQGIMSAFGYMKSKAQSLQKPKSDSNFSKQNAQEYQEYFQNDREQMEQFQEERNKFQQQKMKSNQQDDQLI